MVSALGCFTRDTMNHRRSFQDIAQHRQSMEPSGGAPRDHRISDPGANTIFTAVSTIFGFVDFVASLKEVSDENRIFVSLISRVRYDVDEAFRLRRCRKVADYFAGFPRERSWIDGTIMDVQGALNDLGLYIENARVDMDGRMDLKMKNKFEWVLRNPQKLITRQIALSTCHQSLMVAIQSMHAIELGISVQSPESASARSTSGDIADAALLGPYTRRKKRSVMAKADPQAIAQEIEIASENLPEPVIITPVSLPPITATSNDNLRPNLSLRGTSGYFPSLPILQQNGKPYPELPGCLPSLQSMPHLPTNDYSSARQDEMQPTPREPIASAPTSLPVIPRHASLRSGLSEWIIPWSDVQTEKIVDATSPTSSNAGTITSSPDTVSSTEAASPVIDRPPEQARPMTTQERRRLAHTRRLAAAYDDDED